MKMDIYSTLREPIHHAYSNHPNKQQLAWDLRWSPGEISQRTTLAPEGRAFPADEMNQQNGKDDSEPLAEARLVLFMKRTNDFSYLATLAHMCGFRLEPETERLGEIARELLSETKRLSERSQRVAEQLILSTPFIERRKESRGKR